jgi:hypothetical protein
MATYAAKLRDTAIDGTTVRLNNDGTLSSNVPMEPLGKAYYVDATNGSAQNDGLSWATAVTTVDAAIGKCVANKGDIIYMAPWHAETEAGVDTAIWTMDTIGVSLVGVTQGRQMPTFTFTDDGAYASVTGANCVIKNCKFVSGIVDLASALTLSATADRTTIDGCIFSDGGTAILEMVIGITITAACTDVTVTNCFFNTFVAGSGTLAGIHALGAADRLRITNNQFIGDWNTQAPIDILDAASLDVYIADNDIFQLDATAGLAISVNAATTGLIVRNLLFSGKNTVAGLSTADACGQLENYQTTVETESGNIVPAAGDWAA